LEGEFERTDLGGPVEIIEGVEGDYDAEINTGQSGFIIIRPFPACFRRGLPIIFDGAGWICGINTLKHSAGRSRHSGQDLGVGIVLKKLNESDLGAII
jgi:hypothetical protein